MARLVFLIALVTGSTAHAWQWGERFNHAAHGQKMQAKGKAEVACKSCHQLGAVDFAPIAPGRNDHHPCIDCHGPAEFARGPKCLTCHSSVRGFKPGKPWFPPYLKPGEFHVSFPHAKHVGSSDNCGGCHAAQEGRTAAPTAKSHGACGVCHARDVKPDMNDCSACHLPGAATAPLARPAEPLYRVTQKFDHAAHAQKTAARGVKSACASCHLGLAAQEPPGRPNMQACEGCHDGKTAFDARGTQCARCHTGTPGTPLPAPTKVFRHQAHQQLGVKVEQCTSCHGVGLDWKAVQAGRNQHQPCQQCHAAEFRLKDQPICLSCHERNDPFVPNPLRQVPTGEASGASRGASGEAVPSRMPVQSPEWRMGEVPHPPHLAAGVACATCHPTQAAQKPQGNGHPLCGMCHKDGMKLSLAQCGACHVLASVPRPSVAQRPWSTRARFQHDDRHRAQQKCESCHRTAGVPDLTAPKMQVCADTCHDGSKAFKVTGFDCARCHGAGK